MTSQVRPDPLGGDRVPAGSLDLNDDEHLLSAVGLDRQIHPAMTARHQPPAAFPESLAAHRPRQERRLDRPVKPHPAASRSTGTSPPLRAAALRVGDLERAGADGSFSRAYWQGASVGLPSAGHDG